MSDEQTTTEGAPHADAEIEALSIAWKALAYFDQAARTRAVRYLSDRLNAMEDKETRYER
jgi:hypothetical protein